MVPRRECIGQGASPGVAVGPLYVFADAPSKAASIFPDRSPDEALSAFSDALAAAKIELNDLIAANKGAAAEILIFQTAFLEDEELIAPVDVALKAGMPVERAWRDRLDAEIADFNLADDDHFRARAADLKDIRDRVLKRLSVDPTGKQKPPQSPAIIVAADIAPSQFIALDHSKCAGLALGAGSVHSHVALLARARRIPMVVALGEIETEKNSGALIDGGHGVLVLSPSEEECGAARSRPAKTAPGPAERASLEAPAKTQDGDPVHVAVNISTLSELEDVSPEWCDGIGLVRTEFLFGWDHQLPDEETQYQGYRRIMEWAAGRPVVMRTLDVGGDKPVAGLVHEAETNPFLGKRGVRKTLAHPEVFKTQLRALARAASHGDLCIMVPMITLPEELARVRELYEEATRDLSTRGLSWRSSRIGMMVEVPAAALALNHFETEFLSIGSNDLLQYLTACARDNSAVAGLGKPTHPGFIRLLTSIAEQAADMNIRIGICGDMAADPDHIPLLLDCGLRSVSVPPEALARTKTAIRKYGSRGGGDGG